jgi:hypothetical protein
MGAGGSGAAADAEPTGFEEAIDGGGGFVFARDGVVEDQEFVGGIERGRAGPEGAAGSQS